MKNTEIYLRNFWKIFAWAVGIVGIVVAALVVFNGGTMINYFCSAPPHPFFFLYWQGNVFCPFYVSIISIFVIALGIALVGLLGAIIIDIFKILVLRLWKFIKDYFSKIRLADFVFTSLIEGNNIYIIIYNNEFWLCAKNVLAYSFW